MKFNTLSKTYQEAKTVGLDNSCRGKWYISFAHETRPTQCRPIKDINILYFLTFYGMWPKLEVYNWPGCPNNN